MRFQYYLVYLIFLIIALQAKAQSTSNPVTKSLKIFLNDPELRHSSVGFCVMDMSNGKIVSSHRAEKSMLPASSMKAITTATALCLLGPEYHFSTQLEYCGHIDTNGVLHGNIYIRGGGDPSFGESPEERRLITEKALKIFRDSNIRKINGSIIADDLLFKGNLIPGSWNWEDIGNYYGAGANALTFAGNKYAIVFAPGKKKDDPAPILRIEPPIPGMIVKSDVKTGPAGSGDKVIIYGAPFSAERYAKGTVPAGKTEFKVKGSIPDPAMFAAWYLDSILKADGIEIKNPVETVRTNSALHPDSSRNLLAELYSPPLKTLAKTANHRSDNTYAEAFLKILGYKKGKEGSTEKGCAVVKSYWQLKGVDMNGFKIHDGSGLSRKNAISARQMCHILYIITKKKQFASFLESLPIAGKSGTIRYMLRGTAAQGNMRAKSGTMNGIRTYVGYVTNRSGKKLAFAFYVNQFSCSSYAMRKKMEPVLKSLAESTSF